MKKIIALTVLAFALGAVHQAVACDFSAHAANATPIVVAQTAQQPIAKPDPAAAPGVATDKPQAPSATVACTGSNC